MASGAPDLLEILRRYSAEHEHRARGGLSTIAGISFQLQCCLADFVAELGRGANVQEAGDHFLEAFSDYTKPGVQQVVCVQVKRTLNKTTLGHAAEEAVILDEFFEAEIPRLREGFTFEAVGLIGKKDGSAPSWHGVQLPKDLDDRDLRQQRFEQMLRAGRFRPPRIEPDPWWRIVSSAWLTLDDPFAFAREALAICLRRGMAPEAAVQVRDEIAEAFSRHRRGVHFVGHVVTENDLALSPTPSRDVLLGQIPTLQHLRDGRFMDRPDHVVAALAELDWHVAERDWRQEPYIYAFWVEGRSGNGKSVLLLQLMRQLVIARSERVIWLDDATEQLLPLLETWAESPTGISGLCYVFVDDFYAPSQRALVDFQKISRLTRQQSRADWPILVTCGPPEQRQEWKASGDDEAFRTAGWLLPPAKAREQTRLRQWFRERTGEEPKIGPAFRERESLMISMMFEMREGEMREFGRRFRKRLEDLDLVDALSLPLALNRLYILAPGRWLDEHQSDALRALNRDEDFSMLTLRGSTGQLIRVTHPHLSDAIYKAVRGRDDSIVFARDLHRAFAKSLQSDLATAQLILYRVAENHERLADVEANELTQGMAQAWAENVVPREASVGFDLASAWANWTVWNTRQPLIAKLLGEQPLQRARATLGKMHPHWGSLWWRLWKCSPGDDGLISDAEAWLASADGLQNHQWSLVWENLFEYKKSKRQSLVPLAASGADWLRNNEFQPDWNFVLRPIATVLPAHSPWDSAFRLLDGFQGNRNWGYVFQIVADNLARFDGERRKSVLRIGWEWIQLGESQETPEWTHVWRTLVDLRGELPKERAEELLSLGYGWLPGHEDRVDWNYVWKKLVDLRDELPKERAEELRPLGYGWLAGREDRDNWTHVWEKLVDLRGELPKERAEELLSLGYGWLPEHEDRVDWTFVWQKLEACGFEPSGGKALEELAWGWLHRSENAERGEWDKIWETCFKNGYRNESFLLAGWNWVLSHDRFPQVIGLAGNLLQAANSRDWRPPPELPLWARNWLARNTQSRSWTFGWGPLWSIDPSQETAELVLPWLTFGPPERQVRWVARQLLNSRRPEFIDRLREWEKSHADSPQAAAVRSILDSEAP